MTKEEAFDEMVAMMENHHVQPPLKVENAPAVIEGMILDILKLQEHNRHLRALLKTLL